MNNEIVEVSSEKCAAFIAASEETYQKLFQEQFSRKIYFESELYKASFPMNLFCASFVCGEIKITAFRDNEMDAELRYTGFYRKNTVETVVLKYEQYENVNGEVVWKGSGALNEGVFSFTVNMPDFPCNMPYWTGKYTLSLPQDHGIFRPM